MPLRISSWSRRELRTSLCPPGPREGRDRHRPPPAPEPHQHLQRGRAAEALEALRTPPPPQ